MRIGEELTIADVERLLMECERPVEALVIHCSDTPAGREHDAQDIHIWHLQRGWSAIGYNMVVKLDGSIEMGRNWNRVPAHVKGHNRKTVGVCYIGGGDGEDTRTEAQTETLQRIVGVFELHGCAVFGHRDLDPSKACPSFDIRDLATGGIINRT